MSDEQNDTAEATIAAAIDGAEEVRDPLEGLVENTKTDPSAPFMPEVLERLVGLKQDDPAAFEKMRAELKKAKCRMGALDAAMRTAGDGDDGGGGDRGPTQAEILIRIAEAAELFHTPDDIAFADLDINGHRETWAVKSKGFRNWLLRLYYEQTKGAPNAESRAAALAVIEARALYDTPERAVFLRVGGADGKVYLDLCNKTWQAVEIDSAGWRIVESPPVRFRRAAGMLPLPVPVKGGSIEELRPFLNLRTSDNDFDFILAVAWLLAALRELGPYPVLALFGEQGTAKSTFAKILRALIDPHVMLMRAPPREDRDLYIAANNGHVLSFDNLSTLLEWISDTLCRLSTGGGFATRQLYSDQDEILLNAIRPTILNGIEDVVTRPDLADRAICLTLEPIADDKRKLEKELWDAFELARPRILGALLDAAAVGIKRLPAIQLNEMPRMADFARWATACETALQKEDGSFREEGTFMDAYRGALDAAVESILNSSLVATAVQSFMESRETWSGTATDLLDLLGKVAGEKAARAKTWPADATRLGGKLRRDATFLRKAGIEINTGARQGHKGTRLITITSICSVPEPGEGGESASVAPAASVSNDFNGLGRALPPTLAAAPPPASATTADARQGATASVRRIVRSSSLKNKETDAAAATDAKSPPSPGAETKGIRLSAGRVRELAEDHVGAAATALEETGVVDRIGLERRLRATLAAEGIHPDAIEVEFARVMEATASL